MKRKVLAGLLAVCLVLSLCGCGQEIPAVYVQSVKSLVGMGGIAPGDRFAGMVVSENVVKINKDSEKKVEEILVREGDDVTEGQVLFRYDMEELQLTLDKQRLELEQLQSTIRNLKSKIEQLKKERDRVWATSDKLQYDVEIQTAEVDLKEAELKVNTKEQEIARSEELLANSSVTSPVNGRVQAISEGGTDSNGKPLPYITIQQSGSYRIKGILGELQRGAIMEGSRIRVLSRTDPDALWYATVTLVDYENPSQGSEQDSYYGVSTDPMTSASKYPFYAELDSIDGLLLGQHVYLELDMGEEDTGLSISSTFFVFEADGSAWVWAESGRGRLEKRPVKLGEYNPMQDTYPVLEGLTEEDYLAFPDENTCREGAPVTRELAPEEGGDS